LSSDIWSLPIDANQATVGGKLQPLTNDSAKATLPALAADGSKMVYISSKSGKRDIWVSDPNGKADEAVTAFRDIGYRPLLSPDGKRLVFPVFENRRCLVALQSLSPPSPPLLLKGCFSIWDWSPDGASLLTFHPGLAKTVDLMKISTGDRQTVLSHPISNLFGARLSPDGRWIAFGAGATGARARLYIAPLRSSPPPEREWIAVDAEGAGEPAWSPDGSVLYFRSKRDGFHCIWAQKLGPGKQPAGAPIAILHLHSAGLGIGFLKATDLSVAVAKDRLTLNLGKTTGNIWTMTVPADKPAPVTASSLSQ
jgi:Tol biopolymer transport system component